MVDPYINNVWNIRLIAEHVSDMFHPKHTDRQISLS